MTGTFVRSAPGPRKPPAIASRSTRSFGPWAQVATPQPPGEPAGGVPDAVGVGVGDGVEGLPDGAPVGPGLAGPEDGLAPAPATQLARSSAATIRTAVAAGRRPNR